MWFVNNVLQLIAVRCCCERMVNANEVIVHSEVCVLVIDVLRYCICCEFVIMGGVSYDTVNVRIVMAAVMCVTSTTKSLGLLIALLTARCMSSLLIQKVQQRCEVLALSIVHCHV